ncbi:MAG: class I SAM-dependent methyltransferase [Armatimonadota bacterium]
MIPTTDDLARIQGTGRYREMEAFSDAWLARHADVLTDYARLWSPDPFHAWSRRWEYPWAVEQLRAWWAKLPLLDQPNHPRILDAGSGVTFFPFYLQKVWRGEVTCVDCNLGVALTLAKIDREKNAETILPVIANLDYSLPFDNDTFDAAVCISVLEHVTSPLNGLAELQRVVRPGGVLVCTWDIPARPWALQQDGLSVNGLALEV